MGSHCQRCSPEGDEEELIVSNILITRRDGTVGRAHTFLPISAEGKDRSGRARKYFLATSLLLLLCGSTALVASWQQVWRRLT